MFTRFKTSRILSFLFIPILYCSSACNSGGATARVAARDSTGGSSRDDSLIRLNKIMNDRTGGSSRDTILVINGIKRRVTIHPGTPVNYPVPDRKYYSDSTGGSSRDSIPPKKKRYNKKSL